MVVGVVRDDDAGDGGARDPGAHEDDEPSRRLRRLVRLGVGAAHDGRAESSDVARRQGEAERQPAERAREALAQLRGCGFAAEGVHTMRRLSRILVRRRRCASGASMGLRCGEAEQPSSERCGSRQSARTKGVARGAYLGGQLPSARARCAVDGANALLAACLRARGEPTILRARGARQPRRRRSDALASGGVPGA